MEWTQTKPHVWQAVGHGSAIYKVIFEAKENKFYAYGASFKDLGSASDLRGAKQYCEEDNRDFIS